MSFPNGYQRDLADEKLFRDLVSNIKLLFEENQRLKRQVATMTDQITGLKAIVANHNGSSQVSSSELSIVTDVPNRGSSSIVK